MRISFYRRLNFAATKSRDICQQRRHSSNKSRCRIDNARQCTGIHSRSRRDDGLTYSGSAPFVWSIQPYLGALWMLKVLWIWTGQSATSIRDGNVATYVYPQSFYALSGLVYMCTRIGSGCTRLSLSHRWLPRARRSLLGDDADTSHIASSKFTIDRQTSAQTIRLDRKGLESRLKSSRISVCLRSEVCNILNVLYYPGYVLTRLHTCFA